MPNPHRNNETNEKNLARAKRIVGAGASDAADYSKTQKYDAKKVSDKPVEANTKGV